MHIFSLCFEGLISHHTNTIDLHLVHFIGHDPGFQGKHYISIHINRLRLLFVIIPGTDVHDPLYRHICTLICI